MLLAFLPVNLVVILFDEVLARQIAGLFPRVGGFIVALPFHEKLHDGFFGALQP
jgi:hypothetical protein